MKMVDIPKKLVPKTNKKLQGVFLVFLSANSKKEMQKKITTIKKAVEFVKKI